MLTYFFRLLIAKNNVILPNHPLLLYKKQLFLCSMKIPRRPQGQPMMTFPDRLPYGESNIPDAFAMYQVSRSIVTSTPGAEKGVLRTRHAARLPVQLPEQTAQSLQRAREPPGVPVLSRQATSTPALE